MLHWLYNPNREIKRFVDENIKGKPKDPKSAKAKAIKSMAEINGMRPSDVDSLISELDPKKIHHPKNDEERIDQLFYMMGLLLDDLNFDVAEKDFINEFAKEIEIPVAKVPYIIMEIYNGLKNETPEDEIRSSVLNMLKS
jgi:hypothetical protein